MRVCMVFIINLNMNQKIKYISFLYNLICFSSGFIGLVLLIYSRNHRVFLPFIYFVVSNTLYLFLVILQGIIVSKMINGLENCSSNISDRISCEYSHNTIQCFNISKCTLFSSHSILYTTISNSIHMYKIKLTEL